MLAALTLNPSEIRSLSAEFESASPTEVLQWAFDHFGTQAAIGTSFQGAGLVTIHKALAAGIPVPVFTIDTGLLFQETLELKARLERFFGIVIEPLVPELSVQQQARRSLLTSGAAIRICVARCARSSRSRRNLVSSMPGLPGSVEISRRGDLRRRFWSFMNLIDSGRKIS